ncbi:MAG: PAS domain-containing protein, partial [Rhodospirillaceae bacterium]
MQEALRDLRELRALRNREAAALRDSLAMVDLLRSTGGATTQADVLTALLAAVLRHSGADGVVIAGLDDGVPRTYQAVGSANRDLRLPAALFAEPEATILADLHLGSWAKPLTDSARAFHAVMRAPLALPGVTGGCVIALSKQAEAYGSEDLDFLVKLADVARQALSRVALVEHNAILAAVIDGAEASITIADARDHSLPLIYVNQAFCRLSGYEPEEVLGRNCRFLSVEPKDSPERTRLRQVIRDFDTGTFVLRNQRKNGDLFWNRLTIYPVYGQTRKIDYLVASQSDVTAERDAQDQRDQAKANLATALSSTNQGFLLLDPDGLIIFANSRFRRFFETEQASWTSGQPYREVYQRRLRDTGLSAQDAAAIAEKRFRTMYSMPTVREMVLGDGRVLMVNDQPTDNGGAVTVVTDVTNLKVAERKLEERAAAIDAAQDGIAITDDAG